MKLRVFGSGSKGNCLAVRGGGKLLLVDCGLSCRELTKRFEEKDKTTLEEAISYYQQKDPRGEYVLVIAGRTKEEVLEEQKSQWESLTIEEHMQRYLDQDYSKKDAMKAVAKDRGVSKRDIYQALLP